MCIGDLHHVGQPLMEEDTEGHLKLRRRQEIDLTLPHVVFRWLTPHRLRRQIVPQPLALESLVVSLRRQYPPIWVCGKNHRLDARRGQWRPASHGDRE